MIFTIILLKYEKSLNIINLNKPRLSNRLIMEFLPSPMTSSQQKIRNLLQPLFQQYRKEMIPATAKQIAAFQKGAEKKMFPSMSSPNSSNFFKCAMAFHASTASAFTPAMTRRYLNGGTDKNSGWDRETWTHFDGHRASFALGVL